ncbi:succinate dehydrogenase cytochrome b556 subunit-like [Epargyreus clarus]|uniref:succinate dehydrogenase cytochrome b556 subunit-like n=1 Tax=Epargyreus clarus TaxID=520877 RepID=UPI003C2BBC1B
MFCILATSHLKRNTMFSVLQKYKRCDLLKPVRLTVHILTTSSNGPCGGGGGGGSGGGGSGHQITFKPYEPPCLPKQHDYKNMALNRPMSPHLTIYAPTITATTSIFQRITGIILVFYAVMLSGGSLFLSNGIETYVSMIQSLDMNRISILLIKLIMGAPFAFHYFNGIRFCMWNAARWMAMKDVYDTARKCFILTAVMTVLFALI